MTTFITPSLALVFAALAGGCAVDSGSASGNEAPATREYRTGSNIPVREPRPTTPEEKARAAAPADATQPAEQAVKPTH